MKKLKLILLALSTALLCESQAIHGFTQGEAGRLQHSLEVGSNDTTRVQTLNALAEYYVFSRQDSAIYYTTKGIEISEKINYPYGIFLGYARLSFILNTLSNYPKALEIALKALKLAEQLKSKRKSSIAECYHLIGLLNNRLGNDSIGLKYSLMSINIYKQSAIPDSEVNFGSSLNAALIYLKWHKTDSALFYAKMSYDVAQHYPDISKIHIATTASTLSRVYEEMKNYPMAHQYYLAGLSTLNNYTPNLLTVRFYNLYARFFKKTGNTDSCLYYAQAALRLCQNKNYGEHATDAASILSQVYEARQMPDSALKYIKVMLATRDTIINQSKLQQAALLNFDEAQRQKDIAAAKERYRNQLRFYVLVSAVVLFLLLSIILYRNNRNKQKANAVLRSQKVEIEQQRTKAEQALYELKAAQTQLIQSEKMASLGELTAGIAHEIQNPLNFVNNFSDVNAELVDELRSELEVGNTQSAVEIAKNIKENEQKINQHGKRADAIVKGMLQHSRTSSGQKELADINAMCGEYLRLAYHGLRAKDKDFNAKIETDFDPSVGKINIVPQEFGRVILNLINNAFYAAKPPNPLKGEFYEPTITVSTKKSDTKILISVKDNGVGIPDSIKEKIFQPFFTTKPTGQGTGLGLSLTYDIIKAHGGEIEVETEEGKGSKFIIQLPV